MIGKASMDPRACYEVKKCAEIVFRKSKIIAREGLVVLEEKIDALDTNKNEIHKFLRCKQADNELRKE